jgi:hypothetical protein
MGSASLPNQWAAPALAVAKQKQRFTMGSDEDGTPRHTGDAKLG